MRTVDLSTTRIPVVDYAVQNFLIYLFALGGLFYACARVNRSTSCCWRTSRILSRSTVRSMCSTGSSARSCRMILLAGLPVYAWWQKREARLHAEFASPAPGRVRT